MRWHRYIYPSNAPYYTYPPPHYFPYPRYEVWPHRVYPPVNPSTFTSSALQMHQLMLKADHLIQKLANSKSFAKQVMDAAQKNENQKVKQLLKSTGLDAEMETDYNPDGLTIKLQSDVNNIDCCHLRIALKW
ncbi:hypothetical protein [Halobacillus mangrovi]|uniref:Inner spore coat protein n=1 Tax=Halobacillus mangrovi TaxID=402384 RepID=A0A1W5ZW55_9BACI|nr:hypothetical protein [Halobacillus mangrovi]ARI77518.1 hypothetical protein HM131_11985 [Halobacillus mangrovi]